MGTSFCALYLFTNLEATHGCLRCGAGTLRGDRAVASGRQVEAAPDEKAPYSETEPHQHQFMEAKGRPNAETSTCADFRGEHRHVHTHERDNTVSYPTDGEDVEQGIASSTTPCNYGGVRTWFRCPYCQERIALLYLARNVACGQSFRMTCPSQREVL